jgi:thioredoxin-related protein
MTSKYIFFLTVAACFSTCLADGMWITDMNEAKKLAAEQNKCILIEFTGSDWCRPCMKLRQNVLSKESFQKKAGENFILLELDSPARPKDDEAKARKEVSDQIAEYYRVKSVPTIIFTDANGLPFGGFGGAQDESTVFSEITKALENRKAIQEATAQLEQIKEDGPKLEALMNVLKLIPKRYTFLYSDLKNEIKTLDKDDTYGLKAADEKEARQKAEDDRVNSEMGIINKYFEEKVKDPTNPNEVLVAIRSIPNRDQLHPRSQQQLLQREIYAILSLTGDVEQIKPLIDKFKSICDEKQAKRMDVYLQDLIDHRDEIKKYHEEQLKKSAAEKTKTPEK